MFSLALKKGIIYIELFDLLVKRGRWNVWFYRRLILWDDEILKVKANDRREENCLYMDRLFNIVCIIVIVTVGVLSMVKYIEDKNVV